MLNIKDSHLYSMLNFWRKFSNGFSSINEIYFFIYGYYSVFHSPNKVTNINEDWIDDFFDFINLKLRTSFYPNEELRSCHFGQIINEYVDDPKVGVILFFEILDEFVEQYKLDES